MQNLTLSITQLNNYIKQIFDNEELLLGVSVYGEVTNFKISSGIAYFDIKEEGAQLSCVKFSTFAPCAKNGDKVLVTGRLNYHVKLGRLSFIVSKIESYGMGELYQKYLELKARLEKEGLFDQSKKKPIPRYAKTIGVVTSETGAVIRDIYNVTRSKNPLTNILVYPAKVQGEGAENEICKGIEYFNQAKNVDVIIVARGGGSFEDLSPFNTEKVARCAFESDLPIISAVGHETDFSILDFASDLRAPTPSVGADLAVFNYYDEVEWLQSLQESSTIKIARFINGKKKDIGADLSLLASKIGTKIEVGKKDAKIYIDKISAKIDAIILKNHRNLDVLTTKLEKSNPLSILKAGYAKVIVPSKNITKSELEVGDKMQTITKDLIIDSTITGIKENKL